MAAAAAVIVLLSFLLISSSCNAQDTHAMLLTVVDAIEKLFDFFKTDHQNVNLQGIYGLKTIEGQFQKILDEHREGKHASLSPLIVQRLDALLHTTGWIGKRVIAALTVDKKYGMITLPVAFDQPWKDLKNHRRIVPSLRWEIPVYKSSVRSKINETESDKCMMELVKQNKASMNDGFLTRCNVSNHCALIMTKRGLTDHSVIHQILWTALAEEVGCGIEMDSVLKNLDFKSTYHMQEEFCTNNYYEMLAVIHVFMSGTVKENYRDVFLEQQFVCPSLGFFEFLKKDYLNQILSWQLPSGCFGGGLEKDSVAENKSPHKSLPKDTNKLRVPDEIQNIVPEVNKIKSGENVDVSLLQHQSKDHIDTHKLNQGIRVRKNADTFDQTLIQQQILDDQERNVLHMNQGVGIPNRPPSGTFHGDAVIKFPVNSQIVIHGNMPTIHNGRPISLNRPSNNLHDRHQGKGAGLQDSAQSLNGLTWKKDKLSSLQNSPSIQQKLPAVKMLDRPQESWSEDNAVGHFEGETRQDHKLLKVYTRAQATRRKLLTENEMSGGCSAHRTGMAAGALVMYLRYLIDPGPLDLLAPHDFFPEKSRNLLGGGKSYKAMMSFLGNQMRNRFDNQKRNRMMIENVNPGAADENENVEENAAIAFEDEEDNQEEEREEEDEEEEYDDTDDLYPDKGGPGGQQQERKVVHFGANGGARIETEKEYYDDKREEDKDAYISENEDEEEEEGGDYIKRVKGDDDVAGHEKERIDDDTEYTYYDDEDDENERGIVKRYKPQVAPQPGARIRAHNRQKPHLPVKNNLSMEQTDPPPTRAVVLLLSATSLLLIIFIYRFIRKRRIHLRYNHNRNFFKL